LSVDLSAGRRSRLLPILGLGFGLAVTIGNVIGAGIFRTPGEIATQLPSPALFITAWTVGGVYALLGAIQLAELGTMLPRSGGQYVFARYALGEYAGFVVGWTDWISTCGSTAAVSLVVAEFAGGLFPSLAPWQLPAAAALVIAFALLQWNGTREGSIVQNVTSVLKALALSVLVAGALMTTGVGGNAPLPAPPSGLTLASAFVLALQAVIFAYDGWTGTIYFSEEVIDSGRTIPRAMIGSVVLVIATYLTLNLAFMHTVPLSAMAGKAFAAGVVADAVFGSLGDPIFRTIVIVSLLSTINSNQLMASRVLFAVARDGFVSSRLAAVNRGGTPTSALLLSTAVALVFVMLGQTASTLMTVMAFFFVANYTISFTAVFVLRRREPETPRPYRAWGYPWTTALALSGSVAFLAGAIASDTRNSLYALLVLALSYPGYRLLKRFRTATSG
jgi:APA family basic amino acid/polyamine antiporter